MLPRSHGHLGLEKPGTRRSYRNSLSPILPVLIWVMRELVSFETPAWIMRFTGEGWGAMLKRCLPFLLPVHLSFQVLLRMDFTRPCTDDRYLVCGAGRAPICVAASLASLSALSLPGISWCPGTHWRRIGTPRSPSVSTALRMAWRRSCAAVGSDFPIANRAAWLSE
jgi:hypothetical protein